VAAYNVNTPRTKGNNALNNEFIPKPDRLFVCTGKGEGAAITELRHGLEAKIGFSAPFDDPILRVWALPSGLEVLDNSGATLFLLSFGDTSAVLAIPADASEMILLGESSTDLDLDNRTVTVSIQESSIVQVTEKAIRVIGQDFV
jgi:hypothetical protein